MTQYFFYISTTINSIFRPCLVSTTNTVVAIRIVYNKKMIFFLFCDFFYCILVQRPTAWEKSRKNEKNHVKMAIFSGFLRFADKQIN